jgi:hypothetical protein
MQIRPTVKKATNDGIRDRSLGIKSDTSVGHLAATATTEAVKAAVGSCIICVRLRFSFGVAVTFLKALAVGRFLAVLSNLRIPVSLLISLSYSPP